MVNTNILYELDYNGNIKRQTALCAKMNSISNMLLEGNYLFIPLSGGIMECINIQSMSAVWQSEAFGGQSLSTVFYHEGYIYAGSTTVTNSGTSGIFTVSIRLTAPRYGLMKITNIRAATIGAAALYIKIPYTLQVTTAILFPTVC